MDPFCRIGNPIGRELTAPLWTASILAANFATGGSGPHLAFGPRP